MNKEWMNSGAIDEDGRIGVGSLVDMYVYNSRLLHRCTNDGRRTVYFERCDYLYDLLNTIKVDTKETE